MQHTILFVDDEKPMLNSLAFTFEANYNVITAQSGSEALNIVKSQNISVIVSDQRMPGMSGAELLREVKEISPATMRILLTGYADLEAIMTSLNVGSIFRFVSKPWDAEKLLATIQLACQIYEQMNSLTGYSALDSSPISAQKRQSSLLFLDTPSNLSALRLLFENDYVVHTAESFESAMNIILTNDVSAMTTEAFLNGEECVSFLAALRDIKPNLATVLLTGSKDASLAIRLINEGRIFRYLVKPFTRQLLKDTLHDAIEQYSNPIATETVARHIERKHIFNGNSLQIHATSNLNDVIRRVNAKLSTAINY